MEQESNTSKSILKPKMGQWNTKKHSTSDIIPSKSALKPSEDNNSLSKSSPQPRTGHESSASEGEIQPLSGDESADSKTSPPAPIPSVFDVLISKGKLDTVSSAQSKNELSSSPQLSSLATPKENYDSKSTPEAFNSEDTPITRLSQDTVSSILSVSSSRQPQTIGDVNQKGNNNANIPHKLPADQDIGEKDDGMNEADYNSSPMLAEGFSEWEETSEEPCLMSYTVLPPSPKKQMGRICHNMVKEGKVIVALPSPSKPHPSPKQTFFQSHSVQTKLKHQGKPKEGSNSPVCSSNVKLPQVDDEDLFGEETVDDDQLKGNQECSLDDNITIDQKKSHPSNSSQSIRKEKPEQQTHTNSEKPNTDTNESLGKQNPADPKHFPVTSQRYPEIDQNQGNGQLREDDNEDKMEEEEDSDVLRIEEPSETENEDPEEVVCSLNLTFTELIDIFSINIKPEKQKPKKKPTVPPTRPKKQVRKKSPSTNKTEEKFAQKPPQRTPEKDKLKKRKRNSGSTSQPHTHTPMQNHHHTEETKTITAATDKENSDTKKQSLSILSPKQHSVHDNHSKSHKRTVEGGCYARRSKPAQSIEDNHSTSTKKRRRITPTRIGDLEPRMMASKRSWWEPRTTKEFQWAQNRVK